MTRGSVLGLVLLGLGIFRHFGISYDEGYSHEHGRLVIDFLLRGGRAWLTYFDLRFYGPVFNVSLAAIDKISGTRALDFQLGHLLGYSLFVLAVLAMYGLCKRQFKGWGWGVLGAAFLVASPRIFSHAFVNPKDAPLMALSVISVYFLVRFLESRRTHWIVAAGAASALAIDIRVNAIFIVGLTGLGLFLDALGTEDRTAAFKSFVSPLGAYVGTLVPLVVLFWPYLWWDSIDHFVSAFREMSNFSGGGPRRVLYMGERIPRTALPWHYIPWSMATTTPIPYVVLAVIGLFSVPVRRVGEAIRARSVDRILLLYGAWFVVPVLYVAATHAVLYNEWRQMLFIYPPVVVFAVAGAVRIWRWLGGVTIRAWLGGRISRRRLQTAWVACLIVVFAWVGYRMAVLHPYHAVYFNSLVGGLRGAEGRYTLDYWGLSYKEGLDYLLRSNDGRIRLWTCSLPGRLNRFMFARSERTRLVYTRRRSATYAVCGDRIDRRPYLRRYPTVYRVRRDGVTLLYVKALRSPSRGRSAAAAER